ncbi:hypothetical protein GCM10010399_28030 [Dactylosporangium fulvum]
MRRLHAAASPVIPARYLIVHAKTSESDRENVQPKSNNSMKPNVTVAIPKGPHNPRSAPRRGRGAITPGRLVVRNRRHAELVAEPSLTPSGAPAVPSGQKSHPTGKDR